MFPHLGNEILGTLPGEVLLRKTPESSGGQESRMKGGSFSIDSSGSWLREEEGVD